MRRLVYGLMALVIVGVMPAAARDAVPRVETAACPFPVPDDLVEGKTVTCGYLFTLENHRDPNSRPIKLAYAILNSWREHPQPDPILYLEGGPGGSALDGIEDWVTIPLLADRDFILLDQRGTGYSDPRLNCPEFNNEDTDPEQATKACHDRLVGEGIDLSLYNSAQSAADVSDLRIAMGYDQWNLVGISYGTRLALTVMRDHPQGVRSALLDSVYPPQVNRFEKEASYAYQAFKRLFDRCAADSACNAAYPNLEHIFYSTLGKLDLKQPTVEVPDLFTGKVHQETLYGDALVSDLWDWLYTSSLIPKLPKMIYDTYNGNYQTYTDLRFESAQVPIDDTPPDNNTPYVDFSHSDGVYYSVECNEEMPFNSLDTARANAQNLPDDLRGVLLNYTEQMFSICDKWGAGVADPIENAPVVSDIPTLIFAGEFDPITPPKWGEQAAAYLHHSYFFQFPGIGHGVLGVNGCSLRIAGAFLDHPAVKPRSECLAYVKEPNFGVP